MFDFSIYGIQLLKSNRSSCIWCSFFKRATGAEENYFLQVTKCLNQDTQAGYMYFLLQDPIPKYTNV